MNYPLKTYPSRLQLRGSIIIGNQGDGKMHILNALLRMVRNAEVMGNSNLEIRVKQSSIMVSKECRVEAMNQLVDELMEGNENWSDQARFDKYCEMKPLLSYRFVSEEAKEKIRSLQINASKLLPDIATRRLASDSVMGVLMPIEEAKSRQLVTPGLITTRGNDMPYTQDYLKAPEEVFRKQSRLCSQLVEQLDKEHNIYNNTQRMAVLFATLDDHKMLVNRSMVTRMLRMLIYATHHPELTSKDLTKLANSVSKSLRKRDPMYKAWTPGSDKDLAITIGQELAKHNFCYNNAG